MDNLRGKILVDSCLHQACFFGGEWEGGGGLGIV